MKNKTIRILKNKRGDQISFDVGLAIPLLIFLIVLFLSYVFFTQSFMSVKTYTKPAEVRVYAARILYDKECFSFYDEELDRVYPDIMEEARLNNDVFEKCMNFTVRDHMAAKVEITKEDSTKVEAFYNKENYDLWQAFVGLSGEGSATEYVEEGPIVLMDKNSNTEKAWVKISILMPSSA